MGLAFWFAEELKFRSDNLANLAAEVAEVVVGAVGWDPLHQVKHKS